MTDVLEQLATLPPDKLREAQARLTFLLGEQGGGPEKESTPKVSRDTEAMETMVYEEVHTALAGVGQFTPRSVNTFRRHFLYSQFRDGVAVFTSFIEEQVKPKSKVEKLAVIRFLIGVAVRSRRARCINNSKCRPVELRSIIWDLTEIGQVVERAFPGYLAAGLLYVLIRRELPAPKMERVKIKKSA